jgi:hypothetical protein
VKGRFFKIDRKLIGYNISFFGFGILVSAMLYPLGYLESKLIYHSIISIGTTFIVLGLFVRPRIKKKVIY